LSACPFRQTTKSAASTTPFLGKNWLWFLLLGILMVIVGTFAITWSCITEVSVTVAWLFGFLMLAGGIAEIVNSLHAGRWSGTLVHLLLGVLYAVVGLMIIDQPVEATFQLTLIIAIFLIVSGIFRIVFSVFERFTGWGWVLLNGVVTLFLGMLIYKQWPASGLWVLGLFVGIDLIFNGWSWIMLSLASRRTTATA